MIANRKDNVVKKRKKLSKQSICEGAFAYLAQNRLQEKIYKKENFRLIDLLK
jgi:hypothetical protein